MELEIKVGSRVVCRGHEYIVEAISETETSARVRSIENPEVIMSFWIGDLVKVEDDNEVQN